MSRKRCRNSKPSRSSAIVVFDLAMRHDSRHPLDAPLFSQLQLFHIQLPLVRCPRELGDMASSGLKARGPATHDGLLPHNRSRQPDSRFFAICIVQCNVATYPRLLAIYIVLPLDKCAQTHGVIIHCGIANKSARKCIRLVVNVEWSRAVRPRSVEDPELHHGSAEGKRMDESARRLVGEDASYVTRELEKIRLESALIVGLLLLPNHKHMLVLKDAARFRSWHLEQEIHLTFPFLELVGGLRGMELVWCIG